MQEGPEISQQPETKTLAQAQNEYSAASQKLFGLQMTFELQNQPFVDIEDPEELNEAVGDILDKRLQVEEARSKEALSSLTGGNKIGELVDQKKRPASPYDNAKDLGMFERAIEEHKGTRSGENLSRAISVIADEANEAENELHELRLAQIPRVGRLRTLGIGKRDQFGVNRENKRHELVSNRNKEIRNKFSALPPQS